MFNFRRPEFLDTLRGQLFGISINSAAMHYIVIVHSNASILTLNMNLLSKNTGSITQSQSNTEDANLV